MLAHVGQTDRINHDLDQIDHDLDHIDQIDQVDQIDHDLDHIDHDLDHLDQIDQIDHDLDHLDPNLPLGDAVQDMCGTNPTPGKKTTYEKITQNILVSPRQHELVDHTDQK